jgi:hypothetical protein
LYRGQSVVEACHRRGNWLPTEAMKPNGKLPLIVFYRHYRLAFHPSRYASDLFEIYRYDVYPAIYVDTEETNQPKRTAVLSDEYSLGPTASLAHASTSTSALQYCCLPAELSTYNEVPRVSNPATSKRFSSKWWAMFSCWGLHLCLLLTPHLLG